jgi:hypothetical protein
MGRARARARARGRVEDVRTVVAFNSGFLGDYFRIVTTFRSRTCNGMQRSGTPCNRVQPRATKRSILQNEPTARKFIRVFEYLTPGVGCVKFENEHKSVSRELRKRTQRSIG